MIRKIMILTILALILIPSAIATTRAVNGWVFTNEGIAAEHATVQVHAKVYRQLCNILPQYCCECATPINEHTSYTDSKGVYSENLANLLFTEDCDGKSAEAGDNCGDSWGNLDNIWIVVDGETSIPIQGTGSTDKSLQIDKLYDELSAEYMPNITLSAPLVQPEEEEIIEDVLQKRIDKGKLPEPETESGSIDIDYSYKFDYSVEEASFDITITSRFNKSIDKINIRPIIRDEKNDIVYDKYIKKISLDPFKDSVVNFDWDTKEEIYRYYILDILLYNNTDILAKSTDNELILERPIILPEDIDNPEIQQKPKEENPTTTRSTLSTSIFTLIMFFILAIMIFVVSKRNKNNEEEF